MAARIIFIDEEEDQVLYAYGGSSGVGKPEPAQMTITEIVNAT